MTNGFQSNVTFNQDDQWFQNKMINGFYSNGTFFQDDQWF
jgi:hypothetical protein